MRDVVTFVGFSLNVLSLMSSFHPDVTGSRKKAFDFTAIVERIPSNTFCLLKFDRGNGKMVSWSFKGQMMGFQWKYIGLCVDTTTGETGTAVTASRDGAIKHSTKDLFQKLTAKNLL